MDIPGYKIERLVAEGGMAAVYLAIQESLDRSVALKLLKKFDKPEQSKRFINEGRIIAS
ncbi:MAG: serine/threonine protein kinase, partial [Gammaproteobacteria bacterium]|nr:serine/threonine protein kinase [Gammaproteobacteria bacterium]